MIKRFPCMAALLLLALGNIARAGDVFLLPYFLGNGETGIYFAYSRDGLEFEWLNDGKEENTAVYLARVKFETNRGKSDE
jgi:hypothetical protein